MTTQHSDPPSEAVDENALKYRQIVHRANIPVLVHPIQSERFAHFSDVNACACETYGYSREEFLQLSPYDITDPDDVQHHAKHEVRQRLFEVGHLTFETRHRKASGEIFPVEIDSLILEHAGVPLIVAVIRDISEKKRAERGLLESDARFRTLINQSNDAFYAIRMDGSIIEANQQACRATGYNREEIMRLNVRDIDPEVEIRDDFHSFWQNLATDDPITIQRHHYRKDGTCFPVEVRTSAAMLNGERVILGNARDISERLEQEQRLRENELRFRRIVETVSSLAVQGYDENGTIFFWNEANVPIYGYTPEEAVGKNLVDLIIPDEMADMVRDSIRIAGDTGEMPPPAELPLKRKDGSRTWVYSSHVSVKVGGRFELYCLDADMNSIKQAQAEKERALAELTLAKEAAEKANRAKDDFLAVMSHEMRTPLNPIVGFASLMLEDCREDQRPFLENILNSGDRLLTLIADILDCAKLEHRELRMKPTHVRVLEVCETALDDLGAHRQRLDVSFVNGSLAGTNPIPEQCTVFCDRNVLLRVIDNLLTNACKYTREGFVRLEAGMRWHNRERASFIFSVTDSGIGIAAQNLDALFKPFSQVDHSYTRKYEGAGLGLAVCQKLVDLMEGEIHVESEPGKGSRFWFEVPLRVCGSSGSIDGPHAHAAPSRLECSPHILIAEDRPDNAQLIAHIVKRAGGSFSIAINGREAIKLAAKENFDLILMDLSMPEMNGFDAAEHIRESGHPNASAPILALTAHVSETVKAQCEAVGMTGHISKPVIAADLVSKLNEVLRHA